MEARVGRDVTPLAFRRARVQSDRARRFDVIINDEIVLADYDITGAPNRALQENFAARPHADGEIVVRFQAGWAGEPSVNGIVVTEWPAVWR